MMSRSRGTLTTDTIRPSADLAEATNRFLVELRSWIDGCISRYAAEPPTDVHDQGTFTTGWSAYIYAADEDKPLQFMQGLRDKICDHFSGNGMWRHGYWTMQEVHHGTEHFELFLGTLLRLKPKDDNTIQQLVDAAEHMGNWNAGVPPWFDWETGLFHSIYLGSSGIRTAPGTSLNVPDHMRCVNICLLAYDGTTDSRYLDLAALHGSVWARAILQSDGLPIGLTDRGPVYEFDAEDESVYRSFMGEASALNLPIDRAENFLTSDVVNTFLKLWKLTGREEFLRATEKLLDILTTQLDDPDAGAAADAVRQYRMWTGHARYDMTVLDSVNRLQPFDVDTITLDADRQLGYRPSGVGKRSDMPLWLEDGHPRRHNPITLAVAAEISNDANLAVRALDMGRTYLALAKEVFPDGRHHGCTARSVSAVARGHGRENDAGVTTAVLEPILKAFDCI